MGISTFGRMFGHTSPCSFPRRSIRVWRCPSLSVKRIPSFILKSLEQKAHMEAWLSAVFHITLCHVDWRQATLGRFIFWLRFSVFGVAHFLFACQYTRRFFSDLLFAWEPMLGVTWHNQTPLHSFLCAQIQPCVAQLERFSCGKHDFFSMYVSGC